ncbi:MAG: hypothetical protein P4L40_12250 [Terracidiphilus sp.]|nr:hypothetical protein [Terracidiphilus sp.]
MCVCVPRVVCVRMQIRSMASGAPQFASFRATEVINFTYDEAGVPFSILSYYVDIRPPEELPHEWQQYLDGTKTVCL